MLIVNDPVAAHGRALPAVQGAVRAVMGFRSTGSRNHEVHNVEEITLNLPGRDEKIEEFCAFCAISARRASTTIPTPTWATASGARADGGARRRRGARADIATQKATGMARSSKAS